MSELLTVAEAAKILRISEVRLRIKITEGAIKASKPANRWLLKMADIQNYLDRNDNSLAIQGNK